MDVDSFTKLRASHEFIGDADGLQSYYTSWAEDYERDLSLQNWVAPRVICDIVRTAVTSYGADAGAILDAGCGTGLVGVGLRRIGFTVVGGIDLTEGMVKLAKLTGAYRDLRGDINLNTADQALPLGKYDVVVSCGMFTHNHAEPSALLALISLCRPNGIIVVSARASYARATGFDAFVDACIADDKVSLLFCVYNAVYIAEENGHYWVLRRKG